MGTIAIIPKLIILNERELRKDTCIIVEGGKIQKVDEAKRYKEYHPEFVIKGDDLAVIPCFVNAHTHLSERLLSGKGDGLLLYEWLQKIVWPHGETLKGDIVYYIGKLFAMESLVSGVGLFNDMFVNNGSAFLMNELARSISETGLKALLGRGINEKGGNVEVATKDTLMAADRWHGFENRIFVTLAPTLIHANSNDTLLKIRELAHKHKMRIHIHIAETKEEYIWMKNNIGMTSVEYLDKLGFLNEDVMAAHLVWLGVKDISILKKTGVKGIHNPLSNMRLADGIAPTWAMLKAEVPLGLGTDGSASSDNQDIFSAMRFAAFIPRGFTLRVDSISSTQVFAMATRLGYEVLGLKGGEIREGYPADLTFINIHHPSIFPVNNPIVQLVLSSNPGIVKGVMVDGKMLYYNGKFYTLDPTEIILKIKELVEGSE